MKKIVFFFLLLFIPIIIVNAETVTYDLCKTGCEYNSYDAILNNIKELDPNKTYDFVINIKDNGTYETSVIIPTHIDGIGYPQRNQSTFKVNGEKGSEPTIKGTEQFFQISYLDYTEIKNVNFEGDKCIVEYHNDKTNSSTKITNSTFNCNYVSLNHKNVEVDNIKFDSTQFFIPFINEKVTIKNSTIKGIGYQFSDNEWHPGVRFDSKNVTIENSTITSDSLWDYVYSKVTIKDSTIKLSKEYNSESDSLNITNSTITVPNGIRTFGLMEIDKTTINVNSNVGLTFINGTGVIKNSKINGAKTFGIEYIADNFANKYNLKITNTDLTNNTNSLHLKTGKVCRIWDETTCDYYSNDYKEKNALYKYNIMINTWITGSKIKSILAENGGTVYVDRTNTWSSKPKRANNLNKGNVVELTKGRVIYEQSNKDVLKLNVDKEVNLNKYFEDLGGKVLGEWIVENPSILKIVNGKIVPLKVGKTTITANVDNTYYVLEIEVTADMLAKNPETTTFAPYIVILLLVAISIIYISQKYRITQKSKVD